MGSSVLNNDNLAFYADVLTQIGSAMSETGDIMLYGCDVAQGDEGLSFINELAAITGADVAASDDLTGNTFAGADWDLEKTMGNIEATALVQNDVVGFGNNRLATNTAPTGTVTIAYNTYSTSPAAPEQFETLTADTSTLADDDVLGAFSYQWKANSINIDSAVTPTYQLKTHHSLNFTQGS